jgi:putative FmdB family regulatory protein
MEHVYFRQPHLEVLNEAMVIAEEMTSDFFKLSWSQWRRARYDIQTQDGMHPAEINPRALAVVAKYDCAPRDRLLRSASFDFYRISLQDQNILRMLHLSEGLNALSVFTYILTHELTHIVRFSRHQALYDTPWALRSLEEARVHQLTRKILAPLNLVDLPEVFRYIYNDWLAKEVGSMPIYEYECAACGQVTEKWQKITAAPLTKCPRCGGELHRLISNCAFHLKGSGWYVTDYSGKCQATGGTPNENGSPSDTPSVSEPKKPEKAETSPAPKIK